MKKRIAILSLIAIFVSFSALIAQTKPVAKSTKATTEVKAESKSCCEKEAKATKTANCCTDKNAAECKSMTAAEKAKCKTECKKEGKTCTKTDVKATSKTEAKKPCCDKKV